MANSELRVDGTWAGGSSEAGPPDSGLGDPHPNWRHVATYGDLDRGVGRPGLSHLLAKTRGRIDLVAVDGYGRLSPNRQELNALLAQLGVGGVRVVVPRPSTGRRLARTAANLALADVIASAAR